VTFITKGLKGFGFGDGKILENVRINSLSQDLIMSNGFDSGFKTKWQ